MHQLTLPYTEETVATFYVDHIYFGPAHGGSNWTRRRFWFQGEDGFPGAKGELGTKGDNVMYILYYLQLHTKLYGQKYLDAWSFKLLYTSFLSSLYEGSQPDWKHQVSVLLSTKHYK